MWRIKAHTLGEACHVWISSGSRGSVIRAGFAHDHVGEAAENLRPSENITSMNFVLSVRSQTDF